MISKHLLCFVAAVIHRPIMAHLARRYSLSTILHIFSLLVVLVVTDIEAFHSNVQRYHHSGIPWTGRWIYHDEGRSYSHFTTSLLYSSYKDANDDIPPAPSVDFALDPDSEEARSITERMGLAEKQHSQLSRLAELVVECNQYINLVSRRDCSVPVVFGRHVLPSIALLQSSGIDDWNGLNVIDVGTGGGFPGLPLSILLPETHFMLVDSVGKKLKAVEEMANELGLQNVRVHHGRAEEMVDDELEGLRHKEAYDVCVGRSVAALPKFCFWIQELLKPESGRLVYIIGGDIESFLLSQAESDVAIDAVLEQDGASDKRILIFPQEAVASIAAESGEVKRKRGKPRKRVERSKQRAKGQWAKRDNKPRQRGYDKFKRYSTD